MAYDLRSLRGHLNDNAQFQSWVQGIRAQLAAIGLVQTADTGQINPVTVARPAVSTVAGYEIWRFDDALQATKPVFIKIEYAININAPQPQLIITVGTGTNGGGTLTGQVGVRRGVTQGYTGSAGTFYDSYCSGDSGRLNLVYGVVPGSTDATKPAFFICERMKDSEGDAMDGGVFTMTGEMGASIGFQMIPFNGVIPSNYTQGPFPPVSSVRGQQPAAGSDIGLVPPVLVSGGKVGFGMPLVYNLADIAANSQFTVPHLGATRNYMPFGNKLSGLFSADAINAAALAIPWE